MKNETEITVRLSAEQLYKLDYIAAAEKRTRNNHILHLLRQNTAYFERTHGKIQTDTDKEAKAAKAAK